jgi:cell division septation protein DedD
MELRCPSCGSASEAGKGTGAQVCSKCGASLDGARATRGPARDASNYDGYAVGRRVLKIAPAWLLLCVAGFVVVLLLFSWLSRPVGPSRKEGEEVFKNEAMNQLPARDAGKESKTPPAARAGAAHAQTSAGEAGTEPVQGDAGEAAFSVQVGSFDDRSQANEQVSRLRAAGFDARVEESDAATRFRFQVRSGHFATREEAARRASQLRAKRLAGETVIIEPAKQ